MNLIEQLKWWWISYKIRKMQIKPFTICRFKQDMPKDVLDSYELIFGKRFLFINEISNMQGHGYFIEQLTMKHYMGLHIDSFEEIPEDDL